MKKLTMQLLADSLGLSRVTVWKVLNGRPGVSHETARRVLDAVEKLQEDESSKKSGGLERSKSVALIASRADSSYFWMRIVDQIAVELNLLHMTLHYIPTNIMGPDLTDLRDMLASGEIDGILAVNLYDDSLLALLGELSIPKVFCDTVPNMGPEQLGGDLLLLEGERTVQALTTSLIDKGCRRIGFLGDICYAQTNLLRWKGYRAALDQAGLAFEPELCLTGPMGSSDREAVSAFLSGLPTLPDAFVCASDYMAFLAFSHLQGARCRIPQELMLCGYDDSKEFLLDQHGVSTVHVRKGMLGKRMVSQLLYRMDNPGADPEEIKILPQIVLRP